VSKVHLYKPMSASLLQQFVQWVSGSPPEFTDQKFPAAGYGREVPLPARKKTLPRLPLSNPSRNSAW
jgi:hypothetical protein